MEALRTDLYELTMAAGYFHRGLASRIATCELFVRRLPPHRRFLVAVGLDRALRYLEGLAFTEEQISYLSTIPALADAMTPAFRDYLRGFRFHGDLFAMPEGTVFFANEPVLRITAPIIEAQIVETYLLSAINHATAVASKAARVVLAAGDAGVIEFGTRRVHPDAAVDAARAAYLVGCIGTSNLEAGRRFGIPVMGTAAHMWTMAHPTEEAAFEGYVAVFPNAAILLIDTYDTLVGAARAAAVARDRLKGVRIDSGELLALTIAVRRILDDAGCASAKIVASGDLDEHKIAELRRAGAPIDLYGVGTDLVTSIDAPALGGVYKLVELAGADARAGTVAQPTPVAKFSEGKTTLPGAHQVQRFRDAGGTLARDVIALEAEPLHAAAEPLLKPTMRRGARVAPPETIDAIRARARREIQSLPASLRRLDDDTAADLGRGSAFAAEISPRLNALADTIQRRVVGPSVPHGPGK